MASKIAADHLGKSFIMIGRGWPRTDQRHRAIQDVEELWQLVKARPAQDPPHARNPGIAAGGLNRFAFRSWVEPHCPKFVDVEHTIHEPVPLLSKQNGTTAVESDYQGDD